jgi:cell wall-associated NlpC family hydrolase
VPVVTESPRVPSVACLLIATVLGTFGLVAPAAAQPAAAQPAAERPVAERPATERPSAQQLDRRIADAARRLEVVVEEYNEARDDLRLTVARSKRLDGRLAPMTADLADSRQRVGGLAAETYRRTRSGPTIALFASHEPHQFVDKLLVLNRMATEQRRAVEDLGLARDRIAVAHETLDALAAQQRRQQAQITTRRATVEGEITALRSMRTVAYGGGSRFSDADDVDLPAPPYVSGPAGKAVAFAFRQLGKPYRYGSSGPNSYDCSGLTSSAWARAGVHLPHNARRQYGAVARISRDDLRPGDLIFYYGGISHVAIYIGDGRMIHAPEFGENVRVARYDFQPIHGYGRPR